VRPDATALTHGATHAGGNAYRRRGDGTLEFLLARSRDGSARVLPKGHVEPGEAPAAAAGREVEEEAGIRLAPERSLGECSFEIGGATVRAVYFTMPAPAAPEPGRDPAWLTLDEARRADHPPVPPDALKVLERAVAIVEAQGA
jgi:8-oxo-dGTP pyrophosphatase MutT (NUDIX family)